jgi:hypothetical protein
MKEQQLSKFVGVYRFMAEYPVWAVPTAMFSFALAPILVLRAVFEGLPYQVSYAALFGDPGLVIAFMIVATIFRENRVTRIPTRLQKGLVHLYVYGGCLLFAALVSLSTMQSRSGQLGDLWHDFIVAPIFLYMGITMAPIIWYNGTKTEKRTIWSFVGLLVALCVLDLILRDLNQRWWLVNHGLQAIERMR